MTTSMAHSARTWILAGFFAGVLGPLAVAAEPCVDKNCSNNWWDTDSCSGCLEGLDTTCCGDMTPLAMCPDGRFYFTANLIAFRRDAGQNEIFQTRNTNTLTSQEIFDSTGAPLGPPRVFVLESNITRDPVLSTNDLDFQNSAGYELLMGWKLAESYAVEFSYFDLNDWDETEAVSDATVYDVDGTIDAATGLVTVTVDEPNSLFSPFSGFGNPPDALYDYNDLASINYRSSLDNVELNVRHWITKGPSRMAVSVLWGGRYNSVNERFNYYTHSPASTNAVDIRTENDLWGAQIGTQIDFCWDPGWHTEFEIKGGVAQNRATVDAVYDLQDADYANQDEKDVTSWIGEARLTLVYQFGTHLTTHIGYKALVLADLALASRNFETDMSILADGPWVINNGGCAVYHGPSAGLTVAW